MSMEDKKIVIAVDARMINSSGIGTVIRNILKRMISIQNEWFFYVMGKRDELSNFSFLQSENVEIVDCQLKIFSVKELLLLHTYIPKDVDLVWSPHYNIPIFYFGRLVVTIHDVFHLAMPEYVDSWVKRLYAKIIFGLVKKKADAIFAVSNFTRNELMRYVGVEEKRIHVIYNGVDAFWFQSQSEFGKNTPRITTPYILCVGNVKPHKNLKTVVSAFLKVRDVVPYDLVIVGKKDGFITGDNEVIAMANLCPERIRFTGYVSDEELRQYYHDASIFVFSSLYEGFGLPPLESMAAGCKKILCSNVASMPEILENSVEWFDPRNIDVLANMLKNSGEIRTCDEKLLKNYSWELSAESMICQIKKVV